MKFLTLLLLAALVYARSTEEKDDSISTNDENRNPVDENDDFISRNDETKPVEENKDDKNIRESRDSNAGLTSTITRLKLKNQGPHQFSNQLYVTPRTTPNRGGFSIRQYGR